MKPDPWGYGSSAYEQRKYALALEAVRAHAWTRALEIGCGEGSFTQMLCEMGPGREVVGVDISAAALDRARKRLAGRPTVKLELRDAFASPPAGPFDLAICSEILYYAGRRITALAHGLAGTLTGGGRLVLVHPWPEARVLHAPFRTRAEFRELGERVERDPARPFAITVLERRP